MNLERLRELSGAIGDELRNALDELEKDADVVGGGLRHGEVEWQVRYRWKGLERFFFMSLDEPSNHLLHLAARAGATDTAGRWAYVPVGSTTLPDEIIREELGTVVRGMLQQGHTILNSLGEEDLRPLIHNYFPQEQT
jgi:hypothetical protein